MCRDILTISQIDGGRYLSAFVSLSFSVAFNLSEQWLAQELTSSGGGGTPPTSHHLISQYHEGRCRSSAELIAKLTRP